MAFIVELPIATVLANGVTFQKQENNRRNYLE